MGIDDWIRQLLREKNQFSAGELAALAGLTRQGVQRHLRRALAAGWLFRVGQGRGTAYRLLSAAGQSAGPQPSYRQTHILKDLDEAAVWTRAVAWLDVQQVSRSTEFDRAFGYVTTEMVNNAIDHSEASHVELLMSLDGPSLTLRITDEGLGAFEKVRSTFGLEGHMHSIQELSKGKVTTDPERHSGEGIFFSSKVADRFELAANRLRWVIDNRIDDSSIVADPRSQGSELLITFDLNTRIRTEEVFARFTTDLEFDRTRCIIRLFELGSSFISRSQAKRLVSNLEKFRVVELDFSGVDQVGQGFVDEVFRVWALAHPETQLTPTQMVPPVEFMIRRGLGPQRQ